MYDEDITQIIIAAAMEVHRHLGPGLLESAYEECMCRELAIRETPWARQVALPLEYKGIKLGLILNFNTPLLKDGIRRLVL